MENSYSEYFWFLHKVAVLKIELHDFFENLRILGSKEPELSFQVVSKVNTLKEWINRIGSFVKIVSWLAVIVIYTTIVL